MGRESGQIYALRGTVWRCERQLQAAELASLAAASAPECSTRLAGVHTPRGEPEARGLAHTRDEDDYDMYIATSRVAG